MRLSLTLNRFKLRATPKSESRVTPGKIIYVSKGGVINSSSPSLFFKKIKKFDVPTSVIMSLSRIHKT